MKEKLNLTFRLLRKNMLLILLLNAVLIIFFIGVFNRTNVYAVNDLILCECDVSLEEKDSVQKISSSSNQIDFNGQNLIKFSDIQLDMNADSVLLFEISIINLAENPHNISISLDKANIKNYKIAYEMNNKQHELEDLMIQLQPNEKMEVKVIVSIEDENQDAVLDGSIKIELS